MKNKKNYKINLSNWKLFAAAICALVLSGSSGAFAAPLSSSEQIQAALNNNSNNNGIGRSITNALDENRRSGDWTQPAESNDDQDLTSRSGLIKNSESQTANSASNGQFTDTVSFNPSPEKSSNTLSSSGQSSNPAPVSQPVSIASSQPVSNPSTRAQRPQFQPSAAVNQPVQPDPVLSEASGPVKANFEPAPAPVVSQANPGSFEPVTAQSTPDPPPVASVQDDQIQLQELGQNSQPQERSRVSSTSVSATDTESSPPGQKSSTAEASNSDDVVSSDSPLKNSGLPFQSAPLILGDGDVMASDALSMRASFLWLAAGLVSLIV